MAGRVAPAVISDSIIFYLDAGNTKSKSDYSTNWNDLSRNQYVFSATNSTFNVKYIPTMTFLGTSQSYAQTTQTTPELPSQVTYNVWLRSAQKSRDQLFFSDGGQNTANKRLGYFYLAWKSSFNRLEFGYANNPNIFTVMSFYYFFDGSQNEWVNLTLAVDYTAIEPVRLYKNGTLLATASFYENGPTNYNNPSLPYGYWTNSYSPTASEFPVSTPRSGLYKYVGNYSASYINAFQGDISIAQIYGRRLSADEVLRNYNAMLPRHSWTPGISTDGLQLHLDPADKRSYPGTGTTWTDLSTNGYTFSMNNMTYNSLNKGNMVCNGAGYATSAATFSLYPQTTYNFWVKSTYTTTPQTFLGDGGQSLTLGYVFIFKLNDSLITQYSDGVGVTYDTMMSANFFAGATASTWINVTVAVDYANASAAFYKNGTLNATFSMTGTPLIPRILNKYIGAYSPSADRLNGNVGMFAIYNRILTPTEVYNDYQALRGRYSDSN